MAKGMPKGGGVKDWRDVMGYQMPQGPTSIMRADHGPGLGGKVFPQGSQNCAESGIEHTGKPGLGGDKLRPQGAQRSKG